MDNFRAVEKEEQGAKKKLKLKEEAPPVTDCSLGDWMQCFNCDYLLPPQKLKPFSAMDKYETFNFITDLIQYVILGDDLKYSHCLYWYSRKNIDLTDIMFQRHQSKFKITKRNLKEQQEEETPPVTECSLSDWMERFDCSYLPLPQKPSFSQRWLMPKSRTLLNGAFSTRFCATGWRTIIVCIGVGKITWILWRCQFIAENPNSFLLLPMVRY